MLKSLLIDLKLQVVFGPRLLIKGLLIVVLGNYKIPVFSFLLRVFVCSLLLC